MKFEKPENGNAQTFKQEAAFKLNLSSEHRSRDKCIFLYVCN